MIKETVTCDRCEAEFPTSPTPDVYAIRINWNKGLHPTNDYKAMSITKHWCEACMTKYWTGPLYRHDKRQEEYPSTEEQFVTILTDLGVAFND